MEKWINQTLSTDSIFCSLLEKEHQNDSDFGRQQTGWGWGNTQSPCSTSFWYGTCLLVDPLSSQLLWLGSGISNPWQFIIFFFCDLQLYSSYQYHQPVWRVFSTKFRVDRIQHFFYPALPILIESKFFKTHSTQLLLGQPAFLQLSCNHLYSYIYIYCHPQTDCFVQSELFSVARQARFLKLGSKPGWLKCQSKILPLSHEGTSAREGNLNAYVSHLFCLYISA